MNTETIETKTENRDKNGRFLPGNPGGGRRKQSTQFTELAKQASTDALKTAVNIMNDKTAKNGDRIRAAELIIERSYGKAVQAMELSGTEGGPLQMDYSGMSVVFFVYKYVLIAAESCKIKAGYRKQIQGGFVAPGNS